MKAILMHWPLAINNKRPSLNLDPDHLQQKYQKTNQSTCYIVACIRATYIYTTTSMSTFRKHLLFVFGGRYVHAFPVFLSRIYGIILLPQLLGDSYCA